VRIFVALDIPPEIRRRISDLRAKLESACPGARWARVEGMHVTLKFIGEAPLEKVERIKTELATIRSAASVEMTFRDVGFFPNERHTRVFWVGITATPNLPELAEQVEQRLEPLGIPREQRPFRPHLTLARFKSQGGLERLREALRHLQPQEFGPTRTAELHLYQSHLKPGGAEYTRLATFCFAPLAGDAQ
jgi:2'-5' RNA ligase